MWFRVRSRLIVCDVIIIRRRGGNVSGIEVVKGAVLVSWRGCMIILGLYICEVNMVRNIVS